MVSPVINEQYYTGAFLVSEARGFLSRDQGTLDNLGTVVISQPGGLVLSTNVTGTGTVVPGSNHGNGTLGSVNQGSLVMVGTYEMVATSATQFTVNDPNGDAMEVATVGTVYSDAEIGFEIVAGSTAFAAGDAFGVVIPAGDGNYVPYTGTHPATAILFNRIENIPASSNVPCTVIDNDAEVNAAELQWDPSVVNSGSVAALQATALTQLRALRIKARAGI